MVLSRVQSQAESEGASIAREEAQAGSSLASSLMSSISYNLNRLRQEAEGRQASVIEVAESITSEQKNVDFTISSEARYDSVAQLRESDDVKAIANAWNEATLALSQDESLTARERLDLASRMADLVKEMGDAGLIVGVNETLMENGKFINQEALEAAREQWMPGLSRLDNEFARIEADTARELGETAAARAEAAKRIAEVQEMEGATQAIDVKAPHAVAQSKLDADLGTQPVADASKENASPEIKVESTKPRDSLIQGAPVASSGRYQEAAAVVEVTESAIDSSRLRKLDFQGSKKAFDLAREENVQIPRDLADDLTYQIPNQKEWSPEQRQWAMEQMSKIGVANPEPARYQQELTPASKSSVSDVAEQLSNDKRTASLEKLESNPKTDTKVYYAETLIISKVGDRTRIENYNNELLFDYTKDASGKVSVAVDRITGDPKLSQEFKKAAEALKNESLDTILKDPTSRSQVEKLGELAPSGSTAIAVASYVTNDKEKVVSSKSYIFRKLPSGYEVDRLAKDGKPVPGGQQLLAITNERGQITANQSQLEFGQMRANYTKVMAAEREKQQQAVNAAAKTKDSYRSPQLVSRHDKLNPAKAKEVATARDRGGR